MINQIKPKILAEFLSQKLAVKELSTSDNLREVTASDLIKTAIFKSKNIYQSDSIYEKKEVMHAFIQILIDTNNEYTKNKKISRLSISDTRIVNEHIEKQPHDGKGQDSQSSPIDKSPTLTLEIVILKTTTI